MAVRLDPFRNIVNVQWITEESAILFMRTSTLLETQWHAGEDFPEGLLDVTMPVVSAWDPTFSIIEPTEDADSLGGIIPEGQLRVEVLPSQEVVRELTGGMATQADFVQDAITFPSEPVHWPPMTPARFTQAESNLLVTAHVVFFTAGVLFSTDGITGEPIEILRIDPLVRTERAFWLNLDLLEGGPATTVQIAASSVGDPALVGTITVNGQLRHEGDWVSDIDNAFVSPPGPALFEAAVTADPFDVTVEAI